MRLAASVVLASLATTVAARGRPTWGPLGAADLAAGTDDQYHPIKRHGAAITATTAAAVPSSSYLADATPFAASPSVVMTFGYLFIAKTAAAMFLNDVWQFALGDNVWHRRAASAADGGALPLPRYQHSAVSVGNDVVVFGGGDGGASVSADTHVWGSFLNDVLLLDVTAWQ